MNYCGVPFCEQSIRLLAGSDGSSFQYIREGSLRRGFCGDQMVIDSKACHCFTSLFEECIHRLLVRLSQDTGMNE